uniref:Progestin and adipoQ receptor family member 8 n=1 Tax=Neogobius melanostomus TaxID=47308 RepID=A0A8C6TCQ3_9GOBI
KEILHLLSIFFVLAAPAPALAPPNRTGRGCPPLYREAFVLSGYRPVGLPWRCYVLSLFQIHNDSVKVWCPLLAALYVATRLLLFVVLQGGVSIVFYTHKTYYLQPLGMCFLSLSLAAALLLHPRSEPVRLSLFLLDSAGRGLHQFGRALALSVYSSDADWTDSIMGQLYLPAAAVLSWLSCTAGCCGELFPRHCDLSHRRLLQMGPMSLAFLLDISPVAQRLYSCPWSSSTAVLLHVLHFVLQVVLFLTAAFFLLCPVPECLSPGRFDIAGHSGQLSLVLLTLSTVSQQEALLRDFSWRRAGVVRRFGEEYLLKACAGFIAVTLSLPATALVLRRCGILARSTR